MPTTRKLTFEGRSGTMLAARLEMPEGPHLATALFVHCFACGRNLIAAQRIARRLAAMGIAVLRFDFTGLGHAAGEAENPSFIANGEDLLRAARALAERDMAPSLLIGHSLGGAALLAVAGRIASARAVVALSAPFDSGNVAGNYAGALEQVDDRAWTRVEIGARSFRVERALIEAIEPDQLGRDLSTMERALLVMHAPRDAVVGIENATRIFLAARHPKSFVTMDTADHLISKPSDAEYAADVIAAWAARYIDLRHPAPPPGAPEGVTRVSEADPRGFLNDVSAGPHHHVLADEPKAYGGTNRGMSPYQFLAAGLGACTSMTLRLYARRKGWPLDHVQVEVTHDKVHAQDCVHCGPTDKIDLFTRRVRLVGALEEAQRARLLEIAERCPVHRTLSIGARIKTEISG